MTTKQVSEPQQLPKTDLESFLRRYSGRPKARKLQICSLGDGFITELQIGDLKCQDFFNSLGKRTRAVSIRGPYNGDDVTTITDAPVFPFTGREIWK